jgi:hypothetical protein
MKMKLSKITLLVLTVIFAFSCTQEETETIAPLAAKEHITFKSITEFYKTIDIVSKLDDEQIESWVLENNPNALYSVINDSNNSLSESLLRLPKAYTVVINKNAEFILNDKVIWLNQGNYYEFNFGDDRMNLKKSPENLNSIGSYTITATPFTSTPMHASFLPEEEDGDEGGEGGGGGGSGSGSGSGCGATNTGAITGPNSPGSNAINIIVADGSQNNGIDARYQAEFDGKTYMDCSGTNQCINARLKYVHELVSTFSIIGSSAHSILTLKVKLEYRATWNWKPAGEPRDIDINLDVSGIKFNDGGNLLSAANYTTNITSVNQSYTCKTGNVEIVLKAVNYFSITGTPHWDITIPSFSYIDHRLHGNYYRWKNYFHYN